MTRPIVRTHVSLAAFCAALALATHIPAARASSFPSPRRIQAVHHYITRTWSLLTRSTRDLPRAAPDPKFGGKPPWPVFVAADEDSAAITRQLQRILPPADFQQIDIRLLPARAAAGSEHGLLYLPDPYVVPGGRFNEMYGWDSYFILRGLLRDGRTGLAKSMTDNFLYEIVHYGKVLNANRTYYLTRSQPPLLTAMILDVYNRTRDREWLRATIPAVERYYSYWTTTPHLIESIGLSRYFDTGAGPAPEVLADERDAQGRSHYERVRHYYRTHEIADYDVSRFYNRSTDTLTELFYTGDRSMRESGFDPSNRFGPFSADIVSYAPVCLNVLLYRFESDVARIYTVLNDGQAASVWLARAQRRRTLVDRYLWDEDVGMYFDYNFETGRRRHYEFATTFYPLWAGMASDAQAKRVEQNLSRFEAAGGILTSTQATGSQWDAPFGWAPLQLLAVDGLRRYGYIEDADRLARKFVSLVVDDFEAHGTIVEKYDVVRRSSDIAPGIRFGYSSNQAGFGWTNATVLELMAGLTHRSPVDEQAGLATETRDAGTPLAVP